MPKKTITYSLGTDASVFMLCYSLYVTNSFALKTALSETSAATYFQVCKRLGFFSVAVIRCHDKSNLGRERVYYNSQFKAGLSFQGKSQN